MKLRILFAALALTLAPAAAQAAHCIAWGMDTGTPPMPVCVEWGPDAPAGWDEPPYGWQPTAGYVKLCHKPGGEGVCIRKWFAAGNTNVGNLGEFETTFRVKSYWFNTTFQSTLLSNDTWSCPTCVLVPSGLAGLNNDCSAMTIKAIIVRN
jgi:hypothetical protein